MHSLGLTLYCFIVTTVYTFRLRLKAMVLRFRPQAFLQGDYLIRQGDVGNEMFFLMRGVCVIVVRKKAKQRKEPENVDDEGPDSANGPKAAHSRLGNWGSTLKQKMSRKLARQKKQKSGQSARMTRLSIDTTHDPTIPSNDSFRARGSGNAVARSNDDGGTESIESATQRGRSSVFSVATAGSNKRRRPTRKKKHNRVEFMMSSMSKWKRRLRKWMAFANPLTLKTPSQEGANYVDSYVIKAIRDDPYMVEIARQVRSSPYFTFVYPTITCWHVT